MAGRYMLLILAAHLAAEAADLDSMNAAFEKLSAEFEGRTSLLAESGARQDCLEQQRRNSDQVG